ncbi:hypothetical protein NLG97_g1330 [Lecanicillium saksenae]|uniref:Uncharacterized protein n=1 Tax=Lecanicillium saksenae TaxID=468837 RepID=A0ACC1R5G5_9HYPO|nr:hypothetical protein NLG97_g1330 [Lecanicillium saksenae]
MIVSEHLDATQVAYADVICVPVFDDGYLRERPEDSQYVMESLMMPMIGQYYMDKNRLRIVQAHDTVVERMRASTSASLQKRFAQAMQSYCDGVLIQVSERFGQRLLSLEEITAIRRNSAGCKPLYHLVEYAHGLQIPDEVFDSPIIQELEDLGMDMVAISNDILSYKKEQAEDVPHNMVAVCRLHGMSVQQAFDTVGKLLEHRYQRWDEIKESLPSWCVTADTDVRRYIDGIKSVVSANLNWR